ncbi:DNA-3-methyladenine glycosylase family protein [Brevibacillus ginsengisoli]|uniref:DNA-3-methyladenine glycosylase family protein n=1 Tax=Brevibacillus ginsengisoli TaxID=363854 RepID=UPI003CF1D77A
MFTTTITVTPPYSFERLLRRLESHPDDQFRIDADHGILRRAFRLAGKPVLATLQFAGNCEQPLLTVSTEATLSPAQQRELTATVRHMFSIDYDLTSLYVHMSNDPYLRPLCKSFRGLRYLLDPDLFQSMIRTIIGQQLNLAFAATLTHRLLEVAGDSLQDEAGNTYLLFPTPERVAQLTVAQLRDLQFSQRKAEYIIDFAKAVVEGRVELNRLQGMSDEEVIQYLLPLRGIGRWTVECLLMFGMGRSDLLPAADIGLRNGIQLVYGLTDKPDEQEIRRVGESWAPYRSYISLYIWESVGAARRGEVFLDEKRTR